MIKMTKEKKYGSYDKLCLIVVFTFLIIFLILATLTPTGPIGESDDYMLSSISLERRFSLRMTEEDVEQARYDYPEHYNYIQNSWNNGGGGYYFTDKGIYPWYFGTYSFICLPVKQILRILRLSQSYAFAITNVLVFFTALLVVLKKGGENKKYVLLALLLLACSPIVINYFFWPSAEVFIASCVIIALVFLLRSNHYIAALFISLAATMNAAAIGIGVAIGIDFLILIFKDEKKISISNIINAILKNYKKIIIITLCFLPFIISLLYNLITFGTFVIQAASNVKLSSLNGIFGRFFAYLFDLNIGFLAHNGVALLLFLSGIVYGIIKKDRLSIIFTVAFFLTVLMYSYHLHINCGMTNIARYNAWALPIIIIFITLHLPTLFNKIIYKNIITALLLLSFVTSGVYSLHLHRNRSDYAFFQPLARFILDKAPQLYNPYPVIFGSRTENRDGWYFVQNMDNILIYTNPQGFARKIFVPYNKLNEVMINLQGPIEELLLLENNIEKKKNRKKKYYYISLNKSNLIKKAPVYELNDTIRNEILNSESIFSLNDTHWQPIIYSNSEPDTYFFDIDNHQFVSLKSIDGGLRTPIYLEKGRYSMVSSLYSSIDLQNSDSGTIWVGLESFGKILNLNTNSYYSDIYANFELSEDYYGYLVIGVGGWGSAVGEIDVDELFIYKLD